MGVSDPEQPRRNADGGTQDAGERAPAESTPEAVPVPRDAGAPERDAGAASCAAPNACATATDLGAISGDTGSPTLTHSGTASSFYKVRVREDDDGFLAAPMKLRVELRSAQAGAYDLLVYNDGTCVKPAAEKKGGAAPASLSWGEEFTGNGDDDSKTIVVEVRQIAPCAAPPPTYTLTLAGNK